ncbi:MAG TPA: hypothetical protein VF883_21985 [Thermoanaerobaculia bacterium]|jgi:predicted peptidase
MRHILSAPASPGPWPLLVFLHGYDEGAPTELEAGVTRHGPLRRGSSKLATDEFIVVAPQLPLCGDVWVNYADEVMALAKSIPDTDPSRFYLTGFSFGGNGVFDLALAQPGFWAAAWAVDPTRVPVRDPKLPVWLSIGNLARRQKASFISALALSGSAAGERVWCDEGLDHVGAATSAYRDDEIYRWLLRHRRS